MANLHDNLKTNMVAIMNKAYCILLFRHLVIIIEYRTTFEAVKRKRRKKRNTFWWLLSDCHRAASKIHFFALTGYLAPLRRMLRKMALFSMV